MIDDFNLVLLSGGFYRCDARWGKEATGIDQCYKVYVPVAGGARLEMADGGCALEPGRIYFISGFRLRRQSCPGRMSVYWAHFVPESLYLENPSLATIAGRVGLAPNYFHRRFRALFGMTPFDFMLAQRLNRARRLLASSDLSIKEVAAAAGYDEPPYFARVFARQMGVAPSAYRAAHRLALA